MNKQSIFMTPRQRRELQKNLHIIADMNNSAVSKNSTSEEVNKEPPPPQPIVRP